MDQTVSKKIKEATKTHKFKGVDFIDIFPIMANPPILKLVIDTFAQRLATVDYDKVFMLEARGFLFAPALSLQTGKGCYPIRKAGKLPGECEKLSYKLEYGEDVIEIQKETISKGDKVVLLDDVLATGGTMRATIDLIEKLGGEVVCVLLLSRIVKANGLERLNLPKEKVFWIYDD